MDRRSAVRHRLLAACVVTFNSNSKVYFLGFPPEMLVFSTMSERSYRGSPGEPRFSLHKTLLSVSAKSRPLQDRKGFWDSLRAFGVDASLSGFPPDAAGKLCHPQTVKGERQRSYQIASRTSLNPRKLLASQR